MRIDCQSQNHEYVFVRQKGQTVIKYNNNVYKGMFLKRRGNNLNVWQNMSASP